MSDQPVTPDREALIRMHDNQCGVRFDLCSAHPEPEDAFLGLFADRIQELLDRARQQGRDEGRTEEQQKIAQFIASRKTRSPGDSPSGELRGSLRHRQTSSTLPDHISTLARGGPNRKDEE